MAIDKRAARREYKERVISRGVFALRSKITGETWVGAAMNLPAAKTSSLFQLRLGLHPNKQFQASCNAHGPDSLDFEVLEEFDQDLPDLTLRDLIKQRPGFWQEKLGAALLF